MKTTSQLAALSRAAAFGATALLAVAQAQAREVVWSVGVSNAPPVWQQPRVVVPAQPVYLPLQPIYSRPIIVGQPYVVVAAPPYTAHQAWQSQTYYYNEGWRHHHRHHGYRTDHGWRDGYDQDYRKHH